MTKETKIPTELALPSGDFTDMGALVKDAQSKIEAAENELQRMAIIGNAIKYIGKAVEDRAGDLLLYLQGTGLGFKTDKDDKGGYDRKTVSRIATHAMILGLRMYGNEVNIIGGNLYCTQSGFERLVFEQIDGPLIEKPGFPKIKENTCFIDYTAEWTFKGKKMIHTGHYPLEANKYLKADAYIGKARRRVLRDVHRIITGMNLGLAEDDHLSGGGMKNVTPHDKAGADVKKSDLGI